MKETTSFPSVEWFEMLGHYMVAQSDRYHDLGACDCCMVVKVVQTDEPRLIEVQFKDYLVESVRELPKIEDARLAGNDRQHQKSRATRSRAHIELSIVPGRPDGGSRTGSTDGGCFLSIQSESATFLQWRSGSCNRLSKLELRLIRTGGSKLS